MSAPQEEASLCISIQMVLRVLAYVQRSFFDRKSGSLHPVSRRCSLVNDSSRHVSLICLQARRGTGRLAGSPSASESSLSSSVSRWPQPATVGKPERVFISKLFGYSCFERKRIGLWSYRLVSARLVGTTASRAQTTQLWWVDPMKCNRTSFGASSASLRDCVQGQKESRA